MGKYVHATTGTHATGCGATTVGHEAYTGAPATGHPAYTGATTQIDALRRVVALLQVK